jgi:hypothetical protein
MKTRFLSKQLEQFAGFRFQECGSPPGGEVEVSAWLEKD